MYIYIYIQTRTPKPRAGTGSSILLLWHLMMPCTLTQSGPLDVIRDKDDEGVGYQRYHNKAQGLTSC